jgi:hypothetical protein
MTAEVADERADFDDPASKLRRWLRNTDAFTAARA